MLLELRIVDVQVSHIIIPLRIVRVQEHGLEWELWANSLDNVQQIKHLLNGLVSFLPHTSENQLDFNEYSPVNGQVAFVDSEEGDGGEIALHY